jgi:hypothetical protein
VLQRLDAVCTCGACLLLTGSMPRTPPRVFPLTTHASHHSTRHTLEHKVEMTAPVTVRVIPSQGPFCEDNFTISFFVPYAFQV